MKILIVSAEVSPFAKVGGLADVAGALPKELMRLGHDVRVAMPSYPMVEGNARYNVRPVVDDIPVGWGDGSTKHAFIKTTMLDKVPVYLVGSPEYFREATESKKIYSSGWEPYAFFAGAVLEMLKFNEPRWIPDVITCQRLAHRFPARISEHALRTRRRPQSHCDRGNRPQSCISGRVWLRHSRSGWAGVGIIHYG